MSDAKDYTHTWIATHYSDKVVDSINGSLGDIDFENLKQFVLIPKKGLKTAQTWEIVFPKKKIADYRLIFRYLRTKDVTNNHMLPAEMYLGMEKATPENIEFLKRVERGDAIEVSDIPPSGHGFRMLIKFSGDADIEGEFTMHPVANCGAVTIYLGPIEDLEGE